MILAQQRLVFGCINNKRVVTSGFKCLRVLETFNLPLADLVIFFFIKNYHGQKGQTKQHAENNLYKIQNSICQR